LFFSVVCQPHGQCKILVFLKRSLCSFQCCVPNFTERLCFSSSFVCWQAPFHAVRLRSKRWWVSFEEPVVQLSRFLLKLFRFRSLCRGLCWVWQRSGSAYARRSWIKFPGQVGHMHGEQVLTEWSLVRIWFAQFATNMFSGSEIAQAMQYNWRRRG
jgi:hypothetical protein